jgi:glutaconate CoA-transferase subunit B
MVVMATSGFERMLITGARLLPDGAVVFVGFHWPMIIARIARRLVAPNLVVIYEDGIVEDRLTPVTPTSPSDLAAAVQSPCCAGSLEALFMWLGAGRVEWTLLEAPIVDRRGNVNTTAVGQYDRPLVRLPGSGGGTELASFGRGLVLISASTSVRSYPQTVDYITSPGYLGGENERPMLGYKPDRGPKLLLNPLGLFEFETEILRPRALHPDTTPDMVRATFGWPIAVNDDVIRLPEPTRDELLVTRDELERARGRHYRMPTS